MLKRVSVDQLAVGMYVHEFCGAWIDHPFWRSKFLLTGHADLQRIVDGKITELWIDTARGSDVAEPAVESASAEIVEAKPSVAPAPESIVDSASFGDEVRRAEALWKRSRVAVSALFNDARMGTALQIDGCLPLVSDISDSVMRNAGAMISVVRLKSRDEYTYMHSVAVCALMVGLARQMKMDPSQTRDAGLAGLLHDIGKAHMPLDILNKPGQLNNDEFGVMRSHPERGAALLADMPAITDTARDVCLHHHERIDGTGYPHGLKGAAISLFARMGAVCDVYDALTSNRAYKPAWSPGEALRQMANWTGHFDQTIFQAFVKTVGIYPVGSLVRLKSGRLAVVVEQNPRALLAPKVRVFYSTKSSERMMPAMLDLSATSTTEKIIGCESAADWPFKDLDELSAVPLT